jgi:hypothetical protein
MTTEAVKLPQPIRSFLNDKDFTIKSTIGNRRYYLLRVSAPGLKSDLLLKINRGDPESSLRQRNHVLWTKSVEPTVPEGSPFHIAPVLDNGDIDGVWYWFTTPFIAGSPFAEMGEDGLSKIIHERPKEVLPKVVLLMRHVEKVDALSADEVDARHGKISKRRDKLELLETAIKWARNDTPYLAELLQLLQANYSYLGITNAHGDFTDVNLIIDRRNEPVLIDAEISSSHHYRYYDAAEFYNRLFTRSCSPELAIAFLNDYVKSLPRQSVQKFLNNFLCLSALRCIGNFIEIDSLSDGNGKQKRLAFAKRYAEAIVTYKVTEITSKG